MGTPTMLQVLAQNASTVRIPEGGTVSDAVWGLGLALLLSVILIAVCVPAVRQERWPMVALLGLLFLGVQAGLLLCLTQILAIPPV